MGCEKIKTCPFFDKFKKGLGGHYEDIIKSYCLGEMTDMCKRRQYEAIAESTAPENLTPNGYFFKR